MQRLSLPYHLAVREEMDDIQAWHFEPNGNRDGYVTPSLLRGSEDRGGVGAVKLPLCMAPQWKRGFGGNYGVSGVHANVLLRRRRRERGNSIIGRHQTTVS